MKIFFYGILFSVIMFLGCNTDSPEANSLLGRPSDLYVRNKTEIQTVIKVLYSDSLTFTGILVESVNPESLCDTVSGLKSEYEVCTSVGECK